MRSFILKFWLFAAVIGLGLFLLGTAELFRPAIGFAWICYAVFFVITLGTFYLYSKNMHGRFQNFMQIFFAGIILKLFIAGALVLVYKQYYPDSSTIAFALPFALIYFSFLFFETIALSKLSRKK